MRAFLRRTNWILVVLLATGAWFFVQSETRARTEEAARFPPSRFRPDVFTGYRLRDFPPARPDLAPEINADGLRGPAIDAPRPGQLRVMCLGDSYTLGMHVPQEQTFVATAEARLRERGHDVRLINAGVDGFGLAHMRRLLDDLYERCRPDVIVLTFGDVTGEVYTPVDDSIMWRLRLHGVLLRSELVRRGLLRLYGAEGFSAWWPEVPLGHDDFVAAALQANVRTLEAFARERGVRLLFMVASYRDDRMPEDVEQQVRDAVPGALWIDRAGAFRALGREAWLDDTPRHLAPRGHAVVGGLLTDMLEGSGVLR